MAIGPNAEGMHEFPNCCPVCRLEECSDCKDEEYSVEATLTHTGRPVNVWRPTQIPGRLLPTEIQEVMCGCCGAMYGKEYKTSKVREEEARIEAEYQAKVDAEKAAAEAAEEERLERIRKEQEEAAARAKSLFERVTESKEEEPPEEEPEEKEEEPKTPLEKIKAREKAREKRKKRGR